MESTDSSSLASHPHLPPGFRFHPTDEELVVHYLKRKLASVPLPVAIMAEVDLYKFDPWELPEKASFGEHEWYFFSPRDRKYPNGARPNRAATSGYWKATGTDKAIVTSGGHKVGVKKALVFYSGKPPKGIKTNWIMHEYRLVDGVSSTTKKGSLRLDDWVLCRVYKKHSSQKLLEREAESSVERASYGSFVENDNETFFEGLLSESGGPMQSTSCSKVFGSIGQMKRQVCHQGFWVSNQNGGEQSSGGVFSHDARQGSLFGASTFVGPLADGALRQQYHLPGVNWSS